MASCYTSCPKKASKIVFVRTLWNSVVRWHNYMRWKVNVPHIILSSCPSLCRKIVKVCGNLTKLWQKQFCVVFGGHGVHVETSEFLLQCDENLFICGDIFSCIFCWIHFVCESQARSMECMSLSLWHSVVARSVELVRTVLFSVDVLSYAELLWQQPVLKVRFDIHQLIFWV